MHLPVAEYPADVAAETAFEWKAAFDFANGTVSYFAGGTALAAADGGEAALPLAEGGTSVFRAAPVGSCANPLARARGFW